MTCFRGAKVCSKWLQERIDDRNIQSDNKYKSGLSENSILVRYACVVTLHDYTTDTNDDMTTMTVFHTEHINTNTWVYVRSLVHLVSAHRHTLHMHRMAQVVSLVFTCHLIHMRSWCVRFSLDFDLSFLFTSYLTYLLSQSFYFFTHLKFVDKPAHSAQREYRLHWRDLLQHKIRERMLHCCNHAWMKNWNAVAICEMSRTSWQMGKHLTNGHLQNHLKARSLRLVQWLNVILFLRKTNLVRKCYLEYSSDVHCSRRRCCGCRHRGAGNFGRVRNRCSKAQCKRGNNAPRKGEHFIFPIADGTVKLSGRAYGIRKSALMRDQVVRSQDLREELQGNSEKSEPADETKDDVEARNDLVNGSWFYFIVITSDLEFNSTCRKKKHSQSRWNTV